MHLDANLASFFEKALAAGMPHEAAVGILRVHGWSEKEIYAALAQHYQHATGVDLPHRSGVRPSARDACLYLLLFSTLATWTIGFGSLAFALIDQWLPDPLFSGLRRLGDTNRTTSSMAAVLVAYPFFLLLSRVLSKETATHPEKLESPVRKWLTYMALVIAACIVMGDLITALAYLPHGEWTSRFLAKSSIVLLLAGGVSCYYFIDIRREESTSTRPGRERLAAALSMASVALIVVLGFRILGSPHVQRDLRADEQRTRQLYNVSQAVSQFWTSHHGVLPTGPDQLSIPAELDPVSHQPYDYRPKLESSYELCATFARSNDRAAGPFTLWHHPAGHHCFSLDASRMTPQPLWTPDL